MMRDDLEVRIAVEQAAERQPHHGDRGVVGPAEAPPHFEARFLLGGIVGHRGGARRMQPDRPVKLRHRGEDRFECRLVERPAGKRREDLDAGGAELIDGALGLLDRAHDVGQAERGDKAGEPVGMILRKAPPWRRWRRAPARGPGRAWRSPRSADWAAKPPAGNRRTRPSRESARRDRGFCARCAAARRYCRASARPCSISWKNRSGEMWQ